MGLAFHLAQGGRAPSAEGTVLRLSRALEARVADVEGAADVRHWLQVIGHGEEHEWFDLGTVRRLTLPGHCLGEQQSQPPPPPPAGGSWGMFTGWR